MLEINLLSSKGYNRHHKNFFIDFNWGEGGGVAEWLQDSIFRLGFKYIQDVFFVLLVIGSPG